MMSAVVTGLNSQFLTNPDRKRLFLPALAVESYMPERNSTPSGAGARGDSGGRTHRGGRPAALRRGGRGSPRGRPGCSPNTICALPQGGFFKIQRRNQICVNFLTTSFAGRRDVRLQQLHRRAADGLQRRRQRVRAGPAGRAAARAGERPRRDVRCRRRFFAESCGSSILSNIWKQCWLVFGCISTNLSK